MELFACLSIGVVLIACTVFICMTAAALLGKHESLEPRVCVNCEHSEHSLLSDPCATCIEDFKNRPLWEKKK